MAHILILDDDENFRTTLAQMLTAVGHTVSAADDGLSGAKLFRAHPVDLVLTDRVMPHVGRSAIRVLCEQFPALAETLAAPPAKC